MQSQKRVDDLSKGSYGHKWKGCPVYKSYQAMLEESKQENRPDAMIIGVPPMLHGEEAVPTCYWRSRTLCQRIVGADCLFALSS